MSNIATGIGLSGKERADTRGLEYLIGAEQQMAGQRAAQKKAEQDARQKLVDEVMKNAVFKRQYENPFYQKDFERDAANSMAQIIEAMQEGTYSTNMAVTAHKAMQELERRNAMRGVGDKQMSAIGSAFLKNPNSIRLADPREIDGVRYNAPQEYLNKNASNPDATRIAAENWSGGNWYFGVNQDDDGQYVFNFNPEMAMVMNPVEEGTKFLKQTGVFNVPSGRFRDITQGRTTVKQEGLLPDADSILRTNAHLFSDERFGNTALLDTYEEARKKNPKLGYNEWVSSIDVETVANEYMDSVMGTLKNYEGAKIQASDTKPAPKPTATKPSTSEKNAEKHFYGKTANRKGDELVKTLISTDQLERTFNIPSGTPFYTGTGEGEYDSKGKVKATNGIDIPVKPLRVIWNMKDLSKSRIVFTSDRDDNMRPQKNKTYTYEVKLDMQSFGQLAEIFGTTKEDAMRVLLRDADKGAVGDIRKWAESLGMDASQLPGPGTSQQGAVEDEDEPTNPFE